MSEIATGVTSSLLRARPTSSQGEAPAGAGAARDAAARGIAHHDHALRHRRRGAPIVPAFTTRPRRSNDIINTPASRLLDMFGIGPSGETLAGRTGGGGVRAPRRPPRMPVLVTGIHVLRTLRERRRGWPGQARHDDAEVDQLCLRHSQIPVRNARRSGRPGSRRRPAP